MGRHVDMREDIYVVDRGSGRIEREPVLADRWLRLAYRLPLRPVCRTVLFRYAWVSKLLGWYCDLPLSRRRIPRVVEQLAIDMDEAIAGIDDFRTFNEFFTRKLRTSARPYDRHPNTLVSPADARVTAYPRLDGATCVPVKGRAFTIAKLAGERSGVADRFDGGTAFVFRLNPSDYHRFHYPASGTTRAAWDVRGRYESVNPVSLALGLPVFVENRRRITVLQVDEFGEMLFIEIGAFGVGAIVQSHSGETFDKMDEKGFFKFGGSTIVVVMRPGCAEPENDLVCNTRAGYETRIRAGETIARRPSA